MLSTSQIKPAKHTAHLLASLRRTWLFCPSSLITPKALLLNSTQYSPAWWDFSMGRITKCLYVSINLLSSFLHQIQFRSAEKESCHQDNCSYWPRTPVLGLQRDKVHSFFQKWKEKNAIDMKTGFLSVSTPLFSLSCVYACMCVRAWERERREAWYIW